MRPLTVALAGIDGSGKSTVARLLREQPGWTTLSGLRNHETVGAPFRDLSLSLDAASAIADRCGSYDLKLVALYLQLCLYGPTERLFADAVVPEVLIADRHPVIDATVYLPVLAPRVTGADIWPLLDSLKSEEKIHILAWSEIQARRLGRSFGIRSLAVELARLGELDDASLISELQQWLNCGLPDLVVHLTIPPALALRRVETRSRTKELHENAQALAKVDTRYMDVTARIDPVPLVRVDGQAGPAGMIAGSVQHLIQSAKDRPC